MTSYVKVEVKFNLTLWLLRSLLIFLICCQFPLCLLYKNQLRASQVEDYTEPLFFKATPLATQTREATTKRLWVWMFELQLSLVKITVDDPYSSVNEYESSSF